MQLPAAQSPQLALERRRSQIEVARSVEGKNLRVSFYIDVIGVGEGWVTVNFPVAFHKRPAQFSGGELADGEADLMVSGSWPTWTCGVVNWVTEYRAGTTFYKGARIVYVVTGRVADEENGAQRSAVHFHVEGPALSNPVPGVATEPPLGA